MTLFCDGSGRTSRDALPAFFVPEEEAVLFMVAVLPLARGQFQKGDDTSYSDGHPFRCDETIVEAEGPKAAGVGDVAL